MTDTIFLDTSFFKALVDIRDDFHSEAAKYWKRIENENIKLVTTNFTLDETFTLIRVKCGLPAVLEFRERLAGGFKRMKMLRVLVSDEANAWRWFKNEWRGLSFTDCVSFAVMKRLDITRVATFDRHFAQAGMQLVGR